MGMEYITMRYILFFSTVGFRLRICYLRMVELCMMVNGNLEVLLKENYLLRYKIKFTKINKIHTNFILGRRFI